MIYGLGELFARASNPPELPLNFPRKMRAGEAREFLRKSTNLALGQIPASTVVEVSARTALMERELTRENSHLATAVLRYPPLARFPLFGFRAVIDTILQHNPQVLGHWIAQGQAPELSQTVLAHIARRLTFARAIGPLHNQVFRSGVPLLQAVAAASLVEEHPWNGPAKSFSELMQALEATGITGVKAFSLAVVSARISRTWRARSRDSVTREQSRLAQLQRHSAGAIGVASCAPEQIERLREELPNLLEEQRLAESAVDQLVIEMANAWPEQGLSNEARQLFIVALASDMPELVTRMAQIVDHPEARADLLQTVIDHMSDYLGLAGVSEAFDARFSPDHTEFPSLCDWTSLAYGLQYADHPQGVGRLTSLALSKLAKASALVLDPPYAATRWPERYQSAITRRACSIWFALRVAYGDSLEERTARAHLMHVALEQAAMVLRKDRLDVDTKGWTFRVALFAIRCMNQIRSPDHRSIWSQDRSLPAFARAAAIWSDLRLIQDSPSEAERCLVEACSRKDRFPASAVGFNEAATILDLAVATSASSNAENAAQIILTAWPRIFESWRGLVDDCFETIHLDLMDAVRGDANARQRLLQDPAWTKSACVEAIT